MSPSLSSLSDTSGTCVSRKESDARQLFRGAFYTHAPGFTGVNPAHPPPTLPIRRPKAGKRGQGAHLLFPRSIFAIWTP